LGNASKFTYSGEIKVSLEYEALGKQLRAEVKDTGVGISEEAQGKLFRFFAQNAKNFNRSGMGLGLTISKMIIQRLGGTIDLESKLGQGTTFTLLIPVDGGEL
jgi:two-component system sensor histidine kinase TorS